MLTLGSAGLLYLTLKGRLDTSARYFLIAEMFGALGAGLIGLINYDPNFEVQLFFAIQNFLFINSELTVFFSLLSLLKTIPIKIYFYSIVGSATYCFFIEFMRIEFGIMAPMIMMNGLTAIFGLLSIGYLYVKIKDDLKGHPFLIRFAEFETAITIFWIVQVLATVLGHAPIPRNPTTLTTWAYSFNIAVSVFRYISYIGFRITWLGVNLDVVNKLNQPLAQAINDKNKLTHKLMASNRVIGISALANSLAHQLSQPLTAIALQAATSNRELMKSSNVNQRLVNSLQDIGEQSAKLSHLVQNLRQLFNEKKTSFQPFSIVDACNDILKIIEPTLQAESITLTKEFNSDPIVFGDMVQIQQVLINVFNNSMDAIRERTESSGEIKLTIGENKRFAYIKVDDNGIGINPEFLPFIFDLHQTTKEDGLGIGLWLCQTIMKHHDGVITASIKDLGGATFEIQIPLASKVTGDDQ